jgi:hypothetical protein
MRSGEGDRLAEGVLFAPVQNVPKVYRSVIKDSVTGTPADTCPRKREIGAQLSEFPTGKAEKASIPFRV